MRKCVCSRAFLMSFFCTVLVLLFVFGMLMVDAEGRRLSFNDNAPPAEMLYQADGKAFLKTYWCISTKEKSMGLPWGLTATKGLPETAWMVSFSCW